MFTTRMFCPIPPRPPTSRRSGPSVAKRRAGTRRVDSWASMHGTGSSHARHSHFASSVSGSFYARVPKGSGRIRFHDPRGENKVWVLVVNRVGQRQRNAITEPKYCRQKERALAVRRGAARGFQPPVWGSTG